ncbi:sugar phosphate isomerase/epimerase family protein [Oceanobacillus aidingensis]|uniref:Sugar phosphate isomerase/epimerase family protein n=1 Tax=Oceanobacillus aidingensis TaxID=645964 RepID=A0ABV9JSL1_9BACI
MKLANMNQHYHRYSFEYFLESTLRLELGAIELWGGVPHLYVDDATYQDIKKIKKDIKDRNLELVCFTPEQCIYPINLSAKDDVVRNRSIEYFKKCIDVTTTLECKQLLVSVGYGFYNESIEEAWKRASDSLCILTEEAVKKDVTLLLEQMSTIGSNIITDMETLRKMYKEINSSNLKVMADTVLLEFVGDRLEDYREFGSDLSHIHFVDGDAKTTAHLAWGEGTFNLDNYIKILKELNYDGYLTLELISPKYNWNPEKGILDSINRIKKLSS